jgi:hypothetical protein
MAAKAVPPQLGAKSFSCPHCGALADQTWFKVFIDTYRKEDAPRIPDPNIISAIEADETLPAETKENWSLYFKRILDKELFIETHHNTL